MVEKEKNLIDYAHKILAFKMNVAKSCKAKGIEPPTDEQMSDYINGYGLNVADCVDDYIEHEGLFRCLRTPLEEFKEKLNEISWVNKPTEDEIKAFFETNGDNVNLFCQQRTIKQMNPLERKLYFKTIQMLPQCGLVSLWNTFVEESALYGADSVIVDMQDKKQVQQYLSDEAVQKVCESLQKDNTIRFIQWIWSEDGAIKKVNDIQGIITAYWSEIFERIMCFPLCYERLSSDVWGINYFEEVVWQVITKEIGLDVCTETNEVKFSK